MSKKLRFVFLLVLGFVFFGLSACHPTAQDAAQTPAQPTRETTSNSSSADLDNGSGPGAGSGDGRAQSASMTDTPANVTTKKTNQGAGAYPSVGTLAPTSPVNGKDKSAPADVHKGEQ